MWGAWWLPLLGACPVLVVVGVLGGCPVLVPSWWWLAYGECPVVVRSRWVSRLGGGGGGGGCARWVSRLGGGGGCARWVSRLGGGGRLRCVLTVGIPFCASSARWVSRCGPCGVGVPLWVSRCGCPVVAVPLWLPGSVVAPARGGSRGGCPLRCYGGCPVVALRRRLRADSRGGGNPLGVGHGACTRPAISHSRRAKSSTAKWCCTPRGCAPSVRQRQ